MRINVMVNGQGYEIDTETLPEAAFRYFIEYGVRQSLADAGASKEGTAAKREAANARLARLMQGDVPSGGGGGGVDPLVAAIVAILKSAKARKRARTKYAAEDVPSARDGAAVDAFLGMHFDEPTAEVIRRAADQMVAAKRLEI